MPGHVFKEGSVGMVSRSGTLTYEIVDLLTRAGLGQSTCVGVGGDPIIGTTFVECLREFKNDPQTEAIVICGEIGGSDEEDAADFVAQHLPELPVVAFIGGRYAPPGKSARACRSDHLGQLRHPPEQGLGLPGGRRPGRRTPLRDPRPAPRAARGPGLNSAFPYPREGSPSASAFP